jgi:uncharacterized repeat protein (TIGR01451 family)
MRPKSVIILCIALPLLALAILLGALNAAAAGMVPVSQPAAVLISAETNPPPPTPVHVWLLKSAEAQEELQSPQRFNDIEAQPSRQDVRIEMVTRPDIDREEAAAALAERREEAQRQAHDARLHMQEAVKALEAANSAAQASPFELSVTYLYTIETVHMNNQAGLFSSFTFTNTGAADATITLAYFWPNGDMLTTEGPFTLGPGASMVHDTSGLGMYWSTYVGYLVLNSDQPLALHLDTPDYGIISGKLFQTDGVTPFTTGAWIEGHAAPYQDYFYGGTPLLSDGSYYLGGLPDGQYNLRAWVNYPWAAQWYNGYLFPEDADIVTIAAAGHVQDIDLVMQPGGRITGTIYGPDGVTPLENMNVDLEQGWYGTCTDASGNYVIESVPLDQAEKVTAGGSNNWCGGSSDYIYEYYNGTYDSAQATLLTLTSADDTAENTNFTLEVGGKITGVVTDAVSGLPVANIRVIARDYDTNMGGAVVWSQADGSYTIPALAPGDYRVFTRDTNWTPPNYARMYWNNTDNRRDATRVPISLGVTVPNIDFALPPGGSIAGRVLDQDSGLPVAYHSVGAWRTNGRSGDGACTDSDGYFQIIGLAFGTYYVDAGGWDCNDQLGQYAREFYGGVFLERNATTVPVDALMPDVTSINFALGLGGFITGTITDQDDQPVEGVLVQPHLGNGDCPNCVEWYHDGLQSLADGSYIVGPLPAGIGFGIYANADTSGQLLVNEYYDDVYQFSEATKLAVDAGQTLGGMDIQLTSGIVLTGHVAVPAGYSNAGIQIEASHWDMVEYYSQRTTDANGNFAIAIPPINDYSWTIYVNPMGNDLGRQMADGFNPSQVTYFDFNLLPGGTISGRVTNNGSPVYGVRVGAWSWWAGSGTYTDADGYYTIPNLPQGDYSVRVNAAPYDQWPYTEYRGVPGLDRQTIYLAQGGTLTGIDFDLQPAGRIEGYVHESNGTTPIENARVTAHNSLGLWYAYTQPDGYFTIDLPSGDYKVRFDREGGDDLVPVYNGGSLTWSGAPTVTVPLFSALALNAPDAVLRLDQNVRRTAHLSGVLRAADSNEILPGMHVAVLNIDPAVNREAAVYTCTDANGAYSLSGVWPGQTRVTVLGTCGHTQFFQPYSTTLTITPGGSQSLNLQVPRSPLADRPLTVRTRYAVQNHTPLVGWTNYFYNRGEDDILPALYAPFLQLDDQGNWFADLLTRVPTAANGDVATIGGQLQVTYHLKPGLLWSDGAPLTSSDLRFTWQLLTQPHNLQESWATYVIPLFWLEDVQTPDPQTAVFRYRPAILQDTHLDALYLQAPMIYALPEHVLAGQSIYDLLNTSHYTHYPVGNGPYVVEDWLPGSHLDLRANPNYHKRSLGLPRTERLRLLYTGHPFYSVADGIADATVGINDIPDDYATYGLDDTFVSNNAYDDIVLDNRLPFFSELAVRQAMFHALNRPGIAATSWTSSIVANGYLPPDHPLYPGGETLYDYNLTTAAGLLDAAGWIDHDSDGVRDKNGLRFEFNLAYRADRTFGQMVATTFAADLATIGVDANVLAIPQANFQRRTRHGEFGAYVIGWGYDGRGTPNLYDVFHTSQIPTYYNGYYGMGAFGTGFVPVAASNAQIEAMRNATTTSAYQALLGSHLKGYTDNLPTLPVRHSGSYNFIRPELLDFKPGGNTPLTWNIEQWWMPDNPYDLSVRKSLTANSPAPQPGAYIVYQIDVRNQGYFTMPDVTLIDQLPAEVIFVDSTPAPTSINGQALTWDLGDIAGYSAAAPVRVRVRIPATTPHGTLITNQVNVSADQADTNPGNNGYALTLEVRDDVDLAIDKSGVGRPAVGERFTYYLDYANWGGAPASSVTLTDLLPPQTHLVSASLPPTVNGSMLTWNLLDLPGNHWGGRIQVVAEIDNTGTVVNTANIASPAVEPIMTNNSDSHTELVTGILPPVILRPTGGTTDGTPSVRGLAPSSSQVDVYDLSALPTAQRLNLPTLPAAKLLGTTTSDASGAFTLNLNLTTEGSYILAAKATKAGLTSAYSNEVSITVDFDVPLDPDLVTISADGVDLSLGCVRAQRYTLAHRMLDVSAVLECASQPTAYLEITENGQFTYNTPTTGITDLGGGRWQADFRTYLGEPHSSYEIWIVWECEAVEHRELLLYILIDPDGYLYDQAAVNNGADIANSLIANGVITIYQRSGVDWIVWPANLFNQTNPQKTDGTTQDGVLTPGYYSFLTPAGQYRIEAAASGYQPFASSIITVITQAVHLDIGLLPITGGQSQPQAPAELSSSRKTISQTSASINDVLTVDIYLDNKGGATGQITLEDALLPHIAEYVAGSASASSGSISYDTASRTVRWQGIAGAAQTVQIQYQVKMGFCVAGQEPTLLLTSHFSGAATDLHTLPILSVQAALNQLWSYLPMIRH